MKPKLSVVICTFNREKSFQECLESLTKQSFTNFEVIIIDGGSTDNTSQAIAHYSQKLRIKKIIYRSKELARARDRGWREAKGRLVAWIDDDVVVSPHWAKSIVEIFDYHPEVGGVSGPTIVKKELLDNRDVFSFYKTKGWISFLGKIWNIFFLEGKKYEVGRILKSGAWTPGSNFPSSLKIKGLRDVDYLEACNMALRRNLVAKVGGFDYHYRGVAEWSELDLAIRVKNLGYRLVFSPKVKVNHNISQAGVYPRRTQAKQRMENFLRFYFRHIFKLRSDYIFKFLGYVIFLNVYWGYKAISTKNISWLGGWLGTITGLKELIPNTSEVEEALPLAEETPRRWRRKKPLVSVIIVNFNSKKFLKRCLESVFQEKGDYEVIVVDDGSTEKIKNEKLKMKNWKAKLKIIENKKNLGAAKSRNIGVENSSGRYLLFLDNDTIIKPGWSKEIISFFQKHPKTAIAQAKLLKMGTNNFDYAGDFLGPFGFLIERARSAEDKGQFDQEEKIFALKSAAMLAKREVFEKLGSFDEDYKIFWEDTDICWRCWLAGYEVRFAPQIVVYHAYGTKEKGIKSYIHHQVYYRGCKNTITTLIKNLGAKKLLFVLPINISCWLVLGFLFFLRLDFPKGWAITKGIGWNLIHLPLIWKKRRMIQAKRKISDKKLLALVGAKRNIPYYLGKALAYLQGKPF